MNILRNARDRAQRLGEGALEQVFRQAKRIPAVRKRIVAQYDQMLDHLRESSAPYRDIVPRRARLEESPVPRSEVLSEMHTLAAQERNRWRDGYVSGAVYHGDDQHVAFMNQVYGDFSQANPLHADLWPSVVKYEAEIIAMTAELMGSSEMVPRDAQDGPVCGVVSSGGTESIMLAMKTYRDWARAERGILQPEVVAPISAHVAFDKAAHCFGITLKRVPVTSDYRADVGRMKQALSRRTICIVGSAPGFPHGCIDPVEELSELAYHRRIGFHTDACLGGFLLPFARELGYPVAPFDFRLRGVTSISIDTHKYGYAAKGTSVILYRSPRLRRHQYFTSTQWPGGLYLSPTFAGSRPGGLSAACWAAMVSLGRSGYRDAAGKILATARRIRQGISDIPGLEVLGDPLWVIAFAAKDFDIYRVLDNMARRGWNLNGLQRPPAIHLCVTLRHTQLGVADRFVADLRDAVDHVKRHPDDRGTMAPIYGLADRLPIRGPVADLMCAYLDVLYEA